MQFVRKQCILSESDEMLVLCCIPRDADGALRGSMRSVSERRPSPLEERAASHPSIKYR